jgi:hypothetical protein
MWHPHSALQTLVAVGHHTRLQLLQPCPSLGAHNSDSTIIAAAATTAWSSQKGHAITPSTSPTKALIAEVAATWRQSMLASMWWVLHPIEVLREHLKCSHRSKMAFIFN